MRGGGRGGRGVGRHLGGAWAGDSHSTLVVNSLPRRDPTDAASAARIAVSTTATLQVGSGRARDEMSTVAHDGRDCDCDETGQQVTRRRQGRREGADLGSPWHRRGCERHIAPCIPLSPCSTLFPIISPFPTYFTIS